MNIISLKTQLEQLPYYTKQNLSLALAKKEDNLNYWIAKLLKQKILIPLKKGLYISSFYLDRVKEKRQTEPYLEYLASILYSPSYISLEYALAKYGIIPEAVYSITSISQKSTREFNSPLTSFMYKTVKKSFYTGYTEGTYLNNTYKIATPAKALFDFLYIKQFIDIKEIEQFLIESGRINWGAIDRKAKQEFTQYCILTESKKMQAILTIVKINSLL